MTTDEKLAAILAAVQTDPGNRGLARDPHDNLFTATAGDFAGGVPEYRGAPDPGVAIIDRLLHPIWRAARVRNRWPARAQSFLHAHTRIAMQYPTAIHAESALRPKPDRGHPVLQTCATIHTGCHSNMSRQIWHSDVICVALERLGPASDGKNYTMRGRDVTRFTRCSDRCNGLYPQRPKDTFADGVTIGIGDGGNEIGMGKIPHETIVKNIPNGDLIHCRVPTDHLIVAGVSNWGAYALAAGVYVLRGVKPPADLFDPDREREILEVMVREGPLVDGVTGKQTATVDGLTWDEYVKPLIRIREIWSRDGDAIAKCHRRRCAGGVPDGKQTGPTPGLALGYVQANLVVLPKDWAFDFLLFCQRNPKPCPLLDVTEPGDPEPRFVAAGSDLRTDLPAYRVWKNGELIEEPTDISKHWRDDFVSFVIGCSFTFENALLAAGGSRAAHRAERERADVPHEHRVSSRGAVFGAAGCLDAAADARARL